MNSPVSNCPLSSYTVCSNNTWPSECAMPPCTCPSTSSGLICGPQSSTATYFLNDTTPVSRSMSTAQMCVPNGKVKFDGSKKLDASSPGSSPGGRFFATYA